MYHIITLGMTDEESEVKLAARRARGRAASKRFRERNPEKNRA